MAFKTLYATEDFDDLDEFFDCGSVDFFVVWRRFAKQWWWFLQYQGVSWCTVWTMKSSKLQDFSKAPMVIFPAPGCFPVYRLTSESSKENQSRAVMVIFPVLGCFPVYRLTVSQARKINQKSLLPLHIKICKRSKTKERVWCDLTLSLFDTYKGDVLRNNSIGKQ